MTESRGDYAEVIPMFRLLATLGPDSADFRRQREEIIRHCLPLADNIARRFKNRGQPHEDLVQVARVGLVKAVSRFDVEPGSGFLGFAVPTIMGEIRRHFRDHGWAIKVPRGLKSLSLRINAGTTELSHSLARAPTATELADHLGVDREQVVEGLIASCAYSTYSTDAPVGSGDDPKAFHETIGSLDANFDRVLEVETVRPLIAALPERERTVLMLRFFDNMTQSQIAQRIGVSQMQVSRILTSAITTLREQVQPLEAAPSSPVMLRANANVTRTAPRHSAQAPTGSRHRSRGIVAQRENVA
ncbi:MAG: polymerase sigma-B factor [Mycobacterium sp.]|jgi:RNA polymerase sigma-B factor|nr:polymerase sigma-B factor [Mycobacterium sp.]